MRVRDFGLPLALAAGLGAAGCDDEGDGSKTCEPAPGHICTIVGTGVSGLTPDGLPGIETELYLPQDMTEGPDGHLYLLDWNNHRVRVLKDGVVHTIIGTGSLGDAPNGRGPEINLNHPTHVSFSPDGDLYLAAWHNSKVLRYDPDTQMVETICGTGARSFNGDGLAPLETFLDLPVATAFGPDGTLYISDQANQRIRALRPGDIIETIAGTGTQGYSGDGGPALDAELHLPVSQSAPPAGRLATDTEGNIYLADTLNHVIRRVGTDGIITTIAGTGAPGNGSGTRATEVALHTPTDVNVDRAGNVYIADTMNHCVRRVTPGGDIATVAGVCGKPGHEGDGGPATEALLDRPYGVEIGKDGRLFIADTHNHVIRVVYP